MNIQDRWMGLLKWTLSCFPEIHTRTRMIAIERAYQINPSTIPVDLAMTETVEAYIQWACAYRFDEAMKDRYVPWLRWME